MGAIKFDFGGWATRNDIRCSDGRTIRHGAFKDCDGKTVPLVWNHDHNNPGNVLGHALLENRDEGVYAYGFFNETEDGRNARELVKHGDVTCLSIYANQLSQSGKDVLHGMIREVSLVLAGANPGALIDSVMIHGEFSEEEAVIYYDEDENTAITHAEDPEPESIPKKKAPVEEKETKKVGRTVGEVWATFTEKQKKAVYYLMYQAEKGMTGEEPEVAHTDEIEVDVLRHADGEETIKDVIESLNEEQKVVAAAMIMEAAKGAKSNNNDDEDEVEEPEGETMKHNAFENDYRDNVDFISHSEMEATLSDARRFGSLKESALQHGIADIETYLFPEDHNVDSGAPKFINLNGGTWVDKVMGGVHHTPFSRLKSTFADISEDDARAKGFLADHTHRDAKGNLVDAEGNPVKKKEEVFSLLKRTTSPTTIYKKQKLDRDDIIDITDFDVVSWIKGEMRIKLNEEIARAVLIGDGRLASSDDKISETAIRPIWTDDELYTINQKIVDEDGELVGASATITEKAAAIIDNAVLGRIKYKGAGTPTLFTTETWLSQMLLLKDTNGHRIYKTETELATAMRVKEIVTVPYFENKTRTVVTNDGSETRTLAGLIVNLSDYTVGADKGGAVNLFDDFDIDYNTQKYLIETRCSGSLLTPYSAIALEFVS